MKKISNLNLWLALLTATNVIRKQSLKQFKKHSMTEIEFRILFYAASEEIFPQSRLVELLNVSKASVSQSLKSLEEKQLIQITVDPDDHRHRTINLRAKAFPIMKTVMKSRREMMDDIFSGLTEADKTQLLSLLLKVEFIKSPILSLQKELGSIETKLTAVFNPLNNKQPKNEIEGSP